MKLDFFALFEGTPIKDWYNNSCAHPETNPYITAHVSDMVRLVYLYRYGGTYLDTDSFVLKSLETYKNTFGVEDIKYVNNAVMLGFDRYNPVLKDCIDGFLAPKQRSYVLDTLSFYCRKVLLSNHHSISNYGHNNDTQNGGQWYPPGQFWFLMEKNQRRHNRMKKKSRSHIKRQHSPQRTSKKGQDEAELIITFTPLKSEKSVGGVHPRKYVTAKWSKRQNRENSSIYSILGCSAHNSNQTSVLAMFYLSSLTSPQDEICETRRKTQYSGLI